MLFHLLSVFFVLGVAVLARPGVAGTDVHLLSGYRNFSSQSDLEVRDRIYAAQFGARLGFFADAHISPELRYTLARTAIMGDSLNDHTFQTGLSLRSDLKSPFRVEFLSGGALHLSVPTASSSSRQWGVYLGGAAVWQPGALNFRAEFLQSLLFAIQDSSTAFVLGLGVRL